MRPYLLFLRLLPARFRARHAPEMEQMFAEMLAEASRRGATAVIRLYVVSFFDVARRARAERRRARDEEGWTMGQFVGDFVQDVRHALRGFRRTPGVTGAAVATLALGIGAVAAVYSVVNAVLLEPLPYPEPDRLLVIYNEYPTLDVLRGSQSPGDLADYVDQADLFSGFGSVSTFPQTLFDGDEASQVQVALVTPGFFGLLGVVPVLGRDITAQDDHDVAILSHAYWRDRYGADPGILGKTLPFERGAKVVVGVLPADFEVVLPAHFSVDPASPIWTPIPAEGWGRDSRDRTAHWMNVVARMKPGVSLDQAREQLAGVAAWQRDNVPRRGERQARIGALPLHDEVTREVRPALLVLFGAAALVVMIACGNVANLVLVRALTRRREMAVRAALGGGRVRLARQLLTEGLALGVLGAVGGVLLAHVGVDAILALETGSLPRVEEVGIDRHVLGFVALVTVGATLLFSAAAALRAAGSDVGGSLRIGRSGGVARSESALSAGFIVAEIALSMVLLASSALLLRSFVHLMDLDPGYRTEDIVSFNVPVSDARRSALQDPGYTGPPQARELLRSFYADAERAIEALPGVVAAAAIWPTPLGGSPSGSTYTETGELGDAESRLASSQLVTPDYFDVVGIPFVEGRTFLPEDEGDRLIVDRRMAELMWPGRSAIGRRLEIGWWSGSVWGEIVGVVENVRSHGLAEDDPPTVYRLGSVYAYSAMTIVARVEGDPRAYEDAVRAAMAETEPGSPMLELRPLSAYLDEQAAPTRFVLALVGAFTVLAVGLTVVGLYGVMSYAVGRRTREFGVRVALGAVSSDVFKMVLRRGLTLTGLGVAVGLLGTWALGDVVRPFLVGVSPGDPWMLGSIAALLATVALTACAVPARRATRVDAVVSLRDE